MGAYSPVEGIGQSELEEIVERIHRPVVAELARRGAPYAGLLYAGLMLTEEGPKVLEFNCRFGDPETQALLPRMDGDLLPLLVACAQGDLAGLDPQVSSRAAVTVVLAAAGYPQSGDSGSPIVGIEAARALGALVFHAGTAYREDTLVTGGGRILNVTGVGDTIASARDLAYRAVDQISFPGLRYRRDIAYG
ncbi:MAG: hypothetical protein C4307_02535 [Chloroflexota bacterium]